MGRVTMSLFAVIFFISAAYGGECTDRSSDEFCYVTNDPPVKGVCCESDGSFSCCNIPEYSFDGRTIAYIILPIIVVVKLASLVCWMSCCCRYHCACCRGCRIRYHGNVRHPEATMSAQTQNPLPLQPSDHVC